MGSSRQGRIAIVVTPATSAVTVRIWSGGSFAAPRISPVTNRMYAIVTNVVAPPTSSAWTDEPPADAKLALEHVPKLP